MRHLIHQIVAIFLLRAAFLEHVWAFNQSGFVFKSCTEKGKVALTFDDGPSIYTDSILDTLKANQVKATFFVTGIKLNTSQSIKIVRRIVAEGHTLGSHMYSHKIVSDLPGEVIQQEMINSSNVIFNITGNLL